MNDEEIEAQLTTSRPPAISGSLARRLVLEDELRARLVSFTPPVPLPIRTYMALASGAVVIAFLLKVIIPTPMAQNLAQLSIYQAPYYRVKVIQHLVGASLDNSNRTTLLTTPESIKEILSETED